MIDFKVVIEEYESAYKHLSNNAEQVINKDIAFMERAGIVDFIDANILRGINKCIAQHGDGKFY